MIKTDIRPDAKLNSLQFNCPLSLLCQSSSKLKRLPSYHNHTQREASSMSYMKTVKYLTRILTRKNPLSILDQQNQPPGRFQDSLEVHQQVEGDKLLFFVDHFLSHKQQDDH